MVARSRDISQQQSLPKVALARSRARRHWGIIPTIVLVGVLLYVTIVIAPLVLSAYHSFTNLSPLRLETKFVGLNNYVALLQDTTALHALLTTLRLSLIVTLGANAGGLSFALLINHPGRFFALLRTLFFIPQVLSAVIVSFVWGIILSGHNGILNILLQQLGVIQKPIAWLGRPDLAFYSLAAVVIWQQIGFCTVVYLAALQGISTEVLEAARMDGANAWQNFWRVIFPLLAPGTTTCVVLLLIISLKLFDQVAVLTAGGPGSATETLAYNIIHVGFTDNRAGYASPLAVVLFVLIAGVSSLMTLYLRSREVEA